MKLFELTIHEDGITIRREAEERMTANQKFYLRMALIATTAFLGFYGMIILH